MSKELVMFLLGLSFALVFVFAFRKEIKSKRDAAISTIREKFFKNK